MRTTYPEAYFNFIDVTALPDSRVSSDFAQEFSNMDLFHEDIIQTLYGTMELNQFVLDGSREVFPAEPPQDVPYWSREKSDADGVYVEPPTLDIGFSQAHSSIGLTLFFADDVPAEIRVSWYTPYGSPLRSEVFHPDNTKFFCRAHVNNYGRIVIEFLKSTFPFRYAKMNYVEYGQKWLLGRDVIKNASVYEEIDITSATLSINTAQLSIMDTEREFDLANQMGLWRSLQKEQQIAITEYVDGKAIDCGTFYLDDWSSQRNMVQFSLIDILGVMDKTKFYGGAVYHQVKAGVIIDAIMQSCGVKHYTVEDSIYQTELSGWLGIQSHRSALQQVMFACGAVADTSRSAEIRIYKPERYVSRTIGLNRKFQGSKVALSEYVSSVTVFYSTYTLAEKSKQICKGVYPAGKNKIEFKEPYQKESITASTGTILEVSNNYAVVHMPTAGECILTGRKYDVTENAHTAVVDVVEAGENPKTKSYKGCTLMDAEKAAVAANYILDCLQLRQQVDIRYINAGEAVGQWCNVALSGGGHATTCIMGQTLDLTGGNLASMKCKGYSRDVTEFYFAGTEIYTGEDGII